MVLNPNPILTPDQPELAELQQQLRDHPPTAFEPQTWLRRQLATCARYDVFRWFAPRSLGGFGWSEPDVIRGYLALSSACLTTTFVITQWTAAVKRILASENQALAGRLIPELLAARQFVTVGISHLTTSRQHLQRPALQARPQSDGSGYVLDGYSPWVTGGPLADHIVVGATTDDDEQLLLAMPTGDPAVEVANSLSLIALSASLTGPVHCHNVPVSAENVVAGPCPNILGSGSGARTGGLQTSTLALGLTRSAVEFLQQQTVARPHMLETVDSLQQSQGELESNLLAAAAGSPAISNDQLRSRSNSLVLRATQAALVAAKGAGFAEGHPVGRWCQEALFFLVWSCPQAVQDANLCELATASPEF